MLSPEGDQAETLGGESDVDTDGVAPSTGEIRFEPGEAIGRFTVLETVGTGGMGVVLAAYDPKLDRKVAIKVLRPELTPVDGGTDARARLVREAQAMAQLRHPNVVTVYEVGEHHSQVFLAMEYVGGGTLADYSDARRGQRDAWREIVDAYVAAGRGLVAAHDAGLVHRDFKPANVLVEGDRFQVTDFGIAQRGDSIGPEFSSSSSSGSSPTLTAPGMLMGTPAYVSAERHQGRPADAASDQFAFCVSMWESLFGDRPYTGRSRHAVTQSIMSGEIAKPVGKHDVPQWVMDALRRGLSRHPKKRWPSMSALLETLATPEAGNVGRRSRILLGVIFGLLFTLLPLSGATYGIPTDTSTYTGAVQQTLILIAAIVAGGWFARKTVFATDFNRKSFAAVLATVVLQAPFEIGLAMANVPIEYGWVLHLFWWSSMATMFAVIVDRRFLILSACYFTAFLAALARPDLYSLISSINNAAFIACAMLIWRNRIR